VVDFHIKTVGDGRIQGPFSGKKLKQLARSSRLQPQHLVSQDGGSSWHEATRFSGLEFGSSVPKSNLKPEDQYLRRRRWLSDPYLDNPFRILNLSTDATSREINRAAQKLQTRLRLADPDARDSFDVNEGDIKRAVQELRDPVKRLQYELFWVRLSEREKQLWDESEALREFPQPTGGVAAQRYEAISTDTTALQKSHNLAVLFHGQAITVESLRFQRMVPERFAKEHDQLWLNALRHWSWVLDSDNFWQVIEVRIGELDDARLSIHRVRSLRKKMPRLILEPNVESANHYMSAVDSTNASRHVRYLSSCDLQPNNITAALGRFYDPLVKRMHECIEKYTRQLEDLNGQMVSKHRPQTTVFWEETVVLQDSFIDSVRTIIRTINAVGDLPGMGEERAMDEAALLMKKFALSLSGFFDDDERSTTALNLALDWASSGSVIEKIRVTLRSDESS
jgi:curved DNA-binding protein CbpA